MKDENMNEDKTITKLYKDLYEENPDGILTLDVEGIVRKCNKAISLATGYSQEEIIGKHFSKLDLLREKDIPHYTEVFTSLVRGEKIEPLEITWLHKEGAQRVHACRVVLIKKEGRPVSIHVILRDIAVQKRIAEELKESEKIYQLMVESYNIGVVVIQDGSIVFANSLMRELSGYSQEELSRIDYLSLAHPDERPIAVEKIKERLMGIPTNKAIEMRFLTKNGEVKWIATTSIKTNWNGKPAIHGFIFDITEFKKSEAALRESEETLRSMFENANDGIALLDLDNNFIDLNENALKILGVNSKREILGKNYLDIIHSEYHDAMAEHTRLLKEQGHISELEYLIMRKDGSSVPIETNAGLIKDSFGNPSSIISIFRDISVRKTMEEEFNKTEKLESIGTLAGGIAHDYNNLLTGIMVFIDLAKRSIERGKFEEVPGELEEAQNACLEAKDLTKQLLTFTRSGVPIKLVTSIISLLKDVATFSLRGSNVRCDFNVKDNLWSVEIDEEQISQVIRDIVINASESMPAGGIININARNTVINGRSDLPLKNGRYILISVVDQGTGIKKENLDKIFNPYFTTKTKGSGLGLTTAYSIIKRHGGYITTKSRENVGTTISIFLPASGRKVMGKKEGIKDKIIHVKRKILVMDDEPIIRRSLRNMLESLGYEVELTSDGEHAIEQYKSAKKMGKPFDAVIMDLTVPGGIGGKTATKKLLKFDPDAKLIVSSGYATDPIIAEYRRYGFKAALSKPYTITQMENLLHDIFEENS